VCERGHRLPHRPGYLDAGVDAADEHTARLFRSFGYEHSVFHRLPPQDELVWQRYFSDVPFGDLGEEVGLDAGCGSGRFARFLATRLAALVALDGSLAVKTAARNLAAFPNVVVLRADLRNPPLADHSFGFVCCIGVLHHLADPEPGFHSLVRMLAPGGYLMIFVYSRPQGPGLRSLVVWAATAMRTVTVHAPRRVLRVACAVMAPFLHAVVVLPGRLGERLGIPALDALPLRMYRRLPLRSLWLSLFDVLSAPLERRFAWSEIRPWFDRAGLVVQSVRDDDGLVILARAPQSASWLS